MMLHLQVIRGKQTVLFMSCPVTVCCTLLALELLRTCRGRQRTSQFTCLLHTLYNNKQLVSGKCSLHQLFVPLSHIQKHIYHALTQPWQALSHHYVKLVCIPAGALPTDSESGTKCDRCSQWNSSASWWAQPVPSTGQQHW